MITRLRQVAGARWPARPTTAAALLVLWLPLATLTGGAGPVVLGPDDDPDVVSVVFAPRHEAVLSAEVAGRVLDVPRELGQAFAAGDVLLRIDDTRYAAQVTTAQARLAAAQRELARVQRLADEKTRERHADAVAEAAEKVLEVTRKLYEEGHASNIELIQAQRDVATARIDRELVASKTVKELTAAQRDRAVAADELAVAQHDLAACTLEAPYAGRVARVLIHGHERAEPGMPVLEIVDDRVLLAKFLVPSRLFDKVRIGQPVTIAARESQQTVTGRVSHVAAVLDAASTTFEVYAEVDNADGKLRAGMNGLLRLSGLEAR